MPLRFRREVQKMLWGAPNPVTSQPSARKALDRRALGNLLPFRPVAVISCIHLCNRSLKPIFRSCPAMPCLKTTRQGTTRGQPCDWNILSSSTSSPSCQSNQAGPFNQWPTGMGFEYFHGFVGGDASQWQPNPYATPLQSTRSKEIKAWWNRGWHLFVSR